MADHSTRVGALRRAVAIASRLATGNSIKPDPGDTTKKRQNASLCLVAPSPPGRTELNPR